MKHELAIDTIMCPNYGHTMLPILGWDTVFICIKEDCNFIAGSDSTVTSLFC